MQLNQLDEEVRVALGLTERLGLSIMGDELVVHWGNQGIEPTVEQLAIVQQAIADHVPDPDWIDPNMPAGQQKAIRAKKALKVTGIKALKSVPELREAVALILEALEIEYDMSISL